MLLFNHIVFLKIGGEGGGARGLRDLGCRFWLLGKILRTMVIGFKNPWPSMHM